MPNLTDTVILALTALMCYWSVHTYACETRGQNTRAKAAAKKCVRRARLRRWRADPTARNLLACLFVHVDPSVYQAF